MSKTLNMMVVFHCCGKNCKTEKIDEPGGEAPKPTAPETNRRLLTLEQGVIQVLTDLDNIKNTGRSKVLKKLREHLTKLTVKNCLPENLRIAELIDGIEQAIAMLDQTKMIVRAKRLQRLKQTMAELLAIAGKEQAL